LNFAAALVVGAVYERALLRKAGHSAFSREIKAGYEWLKIDGASGTRNNVFGVQFVTSVYPLSKVF
jgi:hypothetical protein